MRARVRLDGPPPAAARIAAERIVCEALGVELASGKTILSEFPTLLPLTQPSARAEELVGALRKVGVAASVVPIAGGSDRHCTFHPRLVEGALCAACRAPLCVICERQGRGTCTDCRARKARRTRNQRLRVGVLLTVLFGVCLFGVKEWRRRHLGWERPHRVAVVLVLRPGAPIAADLAVAFRELAPAVEAMFAAQRKKYAPASAPPVELSVVGPVVEGVAPPSSPEADLWSLLKFNLALDAYADALDERLGLDAGVFDVRIYVRLTASSGQSEAAEGLGQQHGRVGVVSTEISKAGVDFAWFVAMHEYLHTRGATDKYGPDLRALYPQGYAEPNRTPRLPQAGTELMARGRPRSLTEEDLPGPAQTWVIGEWTAAEIGW